MIYVIIVSCMFVWELMKCIWGICRDVGWWLIKCVLWIYAVPLWDAMMLLMLVVLWLGCKIFRKRTPKLKKGKYLLVYPTWNY